MTGVQSGADMEYKPKPTDCEACGTDLETGLRPPNCPTIRPTRTDREESS